MPVDVSKFPKVPTIGLQPAKAMVCDWAAQMVVLCDCGSPVPILVPNIDRAGVCKTCKTKYVIARFEMVNNNGQIGVNVQLAKWGGPTSASPDLDVRT